MQYAIYLRKSRADLEAESKGEGETLSRHEHILTDLANQKGLKIGKIYKEIVSGETIEARPQMQKLLSDVKERMWEGVLVVEVERLARGETMDQGIVANAFKISNTKIITPMKVYDPNNEFDEEYFEFGLFMSRREYKVINRRLQRGRIQSVNEGKYVGSIAPFGYDRIKIKGDKGYTLKPNTEANTVKIIYDLYAYNGFSINEIAKKINEMGLKPRKKDKWSVSSIKDILSNPVYIGKVKWNARKVEKVYKNEKLIKTRPRNKDFILVEGLHKPIIDIKTWKIVAHKRKINETTVTHGNEVKNPLCGLVICKKCGRTMLRKPYSNSGKEAILYCPNPNCDNISVKMHLVEDKVLQALKLWLNDYKFDYLNEIENTNLSRTASAINTIKTLEAEYKKEKEKLGKIYNFLEDGTYTKDMFKARYEAVKQNLGRISDLIIEYKTQLKNDESSVKENLYNVHKISNIMDIYSLLQTQEDKNNFLKIMLSKVTYLKTEKSIKKEANPTNFEIGLYPKLKT